MILDSVAQAEAMAAASTPELPLAALIEIDCDGHRSGVKPDDAGLLLRHRARALTPPAELRGVLTHAGESYVAKGPAALEAAAPKPSGAPWSARRRSCARPASPARWSASARRRR